MIFQEPMTSLNPVVTVGAQVIEAVRLHDVISASAARERTLELFRGRHPGSGLASRPIRTSSPEGSSSAS